MKGSYVVLFDPAGCLGIYQKTKDADALFRGFNIEEIYIDEREKIDLSEKMKRFASLTDEVIVYGVSSYIELWNPAKYEEEIKKDRIVHKRMSEGKSKG